MDTSLDGIIDHFWLTQGMTQLGEIQIHEVEERVRQTSSEIISDLHLYSGNKEASNKVTRQTSNQQTRSNAAA